MKVILNQDIKGVGKKDEVINASDGYVRNFLFPKKMAVEANNENMAKLKAKQNSVQFKKDQNKEEALKVAEKFKKFEMTLKVKTGKDGKMFGGVSSKEIAHELENTQKIVVDKKKIELKDTIKTLGKHEVKIKLFEGVIARLNINIISE